MITRILFAAALVLGCSPTEEFKYDKELQGLMNSKRKPAAEEIPVDTNEIKSLTAKRAAQLVAGTVRQTSTRFKLYLSLNGVTSIDKDAAKELVKYKGHTLYLGGLTSIDKDVAKEFAKFNGNLYLKGLTSIDKAVAQELAMFRGYLLEFLMLTSIDKNVLKILKSNPNIDLGPKYRD
ncbi:MAG: hypothetical protein ACR2NF_04840 [Pirellulales bacterium]